MFPAAGARAADVAIVYVKVGLRPGVPEASQVILAICRTAVEERTKDPFRGLA